MIPIPKGKSIIKTAKGFCKKDTDKAVKQDTIVAQVTKHLFFSINPALSGTFTKSSFISVSLFRLYTVKVSEKEARSKLKLTFIL